MTAPPARREPPEREAGFTLLEVIVAVTILGAGIVALVTLFTGGLRLAGGSRDLSAASVYAAQRLEEALLAPEPSVGAESGAFGEKYRWTTRSEELSPEEEIPFRATRIEVTVTWDDGDDDRSVDMAAVRWDRKRTGAGAGG